MYTHTHLYKLNTYLSKYFAISNFFQFGTADLDPQQSHGCPAAAAALGEITWELWQQGETMGFWRFEPGQLHPSGYIYIYVYIYIYMSIYIHR